MKVYTTGDLYMASQDDGDDDTALAEAPARLYNPATDELGPPQSVGAILAHCSAEAFWEEVQGADIPPRLLERLAQVSGGRRARGGSGPGRRSTGLN